MNKTVTYLNMDNNKIGNDGAQAPPTSGFPVGKEMAQSPVG